MLDNPRQTVARNHWQLHSINALRALMLVSRQRFWRVLPRGQGPKVYPAPLNICLSDVFPKLQAVERGCTRTFATVRKVSMRTGNGKFSM